MARISDEVRSAVVADLRKTHGTPEGTMRAVAARHGISLASVRRIGTAAGVVGGEVTLASAQNAVKVAALTNAQRRERLASRLLDAAERALADMESPAKIYNFGGRDNTYNERNVDRPPTQDQRNLAIIAGVMLDKHAVLEKFDSAGAAGQQADLIIKLLTGQ